MVATEPDSGGLPSEVTEAGLKYFLEIDISREFIEGWLASKKKNPSLSEVCQRLIQYAINDA